MLGFLCMFVDVLRFAQTMSIQIDVSMFHDGICLRIMFSGQHKC